ncbi:hypothetical protein ACS8E9_11055 [Pseudomonas neustonica]|uniref:Ribosomal protein S3AE n=1 Tax=Pseudomonas neustonica TaxID=2487346 RepID=A0ABX9XHZ1_9PSED|nr:MULTISPECIES: hypothetical protein [Pseudomonas]ROZ82785.1 hypothetical protein EF099_11235 [Pseudomonas sp. SSM44]ROZ84737.1 hypothetical protein EF096_10095 [Pseudomonas neustonica]|tara:strand:+ start:123 stop:521 length:399 start_codon:yes stop_codon:yes gene_type:complete
MTSTALRQACPPGTCDCDRDALLDSPDADARILRLTLHEEKRLLARLESISTLSELEHLQQRMHEQLGIRLMIGPGLKEVRSLRGIGMQFEPQRGLCRKTRKSIPAAIRRSLQAHPEIVFDLLNSQDLLRDA